MAKKGQPSPAFGGLAPKPKEEDLNPFHLPKKEIDLADQ
jgi:hypothetical protein